MKTEALLKDIKNLSREAEDLVKATASDISDGTREARRRLTAAVEAAGETCCELQEKARNGARATDTVIRNNPYATAGIAFGVGLLIGLLTASGRS